MSFLLLFREQLRFKEHKAKTLKPPVQLVGKRFTENAYNNLIILQFKFVFPIALLREGDFFD